MTLSKFGFLAAVLICLSSCASGYKTINPERLNYNSSDEKDGITVHYRYDLLHKRYAKKEKRKGVQLVALKITNNSEKDIVFGSDLKLAHAGGAEIYTVQNEQVFKSLRQGTPIYLLYLLLTPLQLQVTTVSGSSVQTKTTPIGLFLGPGIAFGNMIAAGSANQKLKQQLQQYNLHGLTIKAGETETDLVGIKSDFYDVIKIKLE